MLKSLRQQRPDDQLTLFCRQGLGSFFTSAELVDEVIEVDKKSRSGWKEVSASLKARNFGLLICPHQSIRSSIFVSGIKAGMKIGYSSWLNRLVFDKCVDRPMALPEALRQLALLAPIDQTVNAKLLNYTQSQIYPGGRSSYSELLPVPGWAEMGIPKLLDLRSRFRSLKSIPDDLPIKVRGMLASVGLGEKPVAVIAPGSVWRTKMWTHDGFVKVGQELEQSGYQILLMGAPDESLLCSEISSKIPNAISIAGETKVFESAQVMALCDLIICNDSGSMHLAAAAGLPSVSIFGPTILDFGYRPWQSRALVAQVVEGALPCRPCGTHGAKDCPLGTHECMKLVAPERVVSLAKSIS